MAAPRVECIKINADASISNDGWVRLGVMDRDRRGSIFFAASHIIRARLPVEVAEGKALCLALKLARSHGLQNMLLNPIVKCW